MRGTLLAAAALAMPSSVIIVCLLSSSVHALRMPAAPVMKDTLGRRVLLLAPLAPLLAAPARAIAFVPSSEDKRKSDREKVAKDRAALQKKSQNRVKKEVGVLAKTNPDKARKQLANVKKANDKDRTKFNQQRLAKQKEDSKIARVRANKQRRAQGKKISKGGGLGLPLTILLVGGLGVGVLSLAGDDNPVEGAIAGAGATAGGGGGVASWYDAGKRLG